MGDLLLFAAAGFAATFVDGALGMGFGPTSSSILLGTGLAPAAVSTSVNIAKLVTGIASAIAHWRLRNVERGNATLPLRRGHSSGLPAQQSVQSALRLRWNRGPGVLVGGALHLQRCGQGGHTGAVVVPDRRDGQTADPSALRLR